MNKLKNMRLGDIKVTTAIVIAVIGLVLYKFGFATVGLVALAIGVAYGVYFIIRFKIKILREYIDENGTPAIVLVTMAIVTWAFVGIHYATK